MINFKASEHKEKNCWTLLKEVINFCLLVKELLSFIIIISLFQDHQKEAERKKLRYCIQNYVSEFIKKILHRY